MGQIAVSNLSFCYDGNYDNVFTNISFNIDTNWKLGLIGRNGKGKTTLLKLFMNEYVYNGSITSNIKFDYFPYDISTCDLNEPVNHLISFWKPNVELWQVILQMNSLQMKTEILDMPFNTLSYGERSRIMLAVLFATENEFLLIDEPTNHLDYDARNIIRDFLSKKKGFILVSHDRDLLDATVDHLLILNKSTVEIQNGNFSSWWVNKEKKDAFTISENEKHIKEIHKLKVASERTANWAKKNESSKIGFDPIKENDRDISTRSFIGKRTKKLQSRVKSYEKRIGREIDAKEGLLKDVESVDELKICPITSTKNPLVATKNFAIGYKEDSMLFSHLSFEINSSDRILISGNNGCGKSTLIKAILNKNAINNKNSTNNIFFTEGILYTINNLTISYINQDTSFLKGTLEDFCIQENLDASLLFSIMSQLGVTREQFYKKIENYSEGQKKKLLIAQSLIKPAHLYIWDEPLNYIDVFTRIQIEKLILKYSPTMLIVDHDIQFQNNIATKRIKLNEYQSRIY